MDNTTKKNSLFLNNLYEEIRTLPAPFLMSQIQYLTSDSLSLLYIKDSNKTVFDVSVCKF